MSPIAGIDASRYSAGVRTGTETYSRELIDAMASIDDLPFAVRSYVNKADSASIERLSALGEVRQIPFPRFWTHVRLSAEMMRNRPNLLFVPSHVIPLIHPRSVVTVHDLGYLHVPDAHPAGQRRMLDMTTRWNARVASHLIAISNTTRSDLINSYGVSPGKITVIHHGVSHQFRPASEAEIRRLRAAFDLPDRFALAVGTIQPRKNLVRLAQAIARLQGAIPDLSLVVAGKRGWLSDQVTAQVAEALPPDRFHELGYVAQDDLPALYSAATVTTMVSTYEGFGLPVLEAMRCGTPLVISDTPALLEVAGDAALVAPGTSSAGLADQINRVILDHSLAAEYRKRGIERAAQFSWAKTASETVALLQRVIQKH